MRPLVEAPYQAFGWVALPEELVSKKCVVNIKNTDSKCFQWCLILKELLDTGTHPDPRRAYEVPPFQLLIRHLLRDEK